MNRVDFYLLTENSHRDRFVCSITNKAFQTGNIVYIRADSREAAMNLDDLLWTFHDISFVPHTLAGQTDATDVPVIIGWQDEAPGHCDTLINLSNEIPASAGRFARIVEIVTGNDAEKEMARNRYRGYRDRGCEMHNHTIEGDHDHT